MNHPLHVRRPYPLGMRKPTRANPPNTRDPMAEPTLGRRMVAAGIRKCGNKLQFANAIGKSYQAVDAWELDRSTPDLVSITKTETLTGFSIEQLVHGRDGIDERVRSAMDALGATPAEREEFARHTQGNGRYDSLTAEYVTAWIKRGRVVEAEPPPVRERERTTAAREATVAEKAVKKSVRRSIPPKSKTGPQLRRKPSQSDREQHD